MSLTKGLAEEAVLGAAVMSSDCAALVFGQLDGSDFGDSDRAAAFTAMQAEWQKVGPRFDAVVAARTVNAELITRWAEVAPSVDPDSVQLYIGIIKDAATARRLQGVALRMAMEGDPDVHSLMDDMAELEKILQGRAGHDGWVDAKTGARTVWQHLNGQPRQYITTGDFPRLDKHTRLDGGKFLVVGGRPSAGKTMASLNLALGWAKHGYKVAYFSLETEPRELYEKLLASWLGVDYGQLQDGTLPVDDYELQQEVVNFQALPLQICNASGRSVAWMRAEAARLGAKIVVVDYLQLVRSAGKSRYEIVTNTSMELHEWAMLDSVLVVGLCQLSRQGVEAPSLTDLRESGQIEQDADAIILLHKLVDAETDEVTEYRWQLDKNKNGQTGIFRMVWDAARQRVREVVR